MLLNSVVQEHADSLIFSFEAPLKEYVRMVKSAKAVMADRSLALSTLQSARSDVDAKRTKLAKLRGTPGIKACPALHPCSLGHGNPCSTMPMGDCVQPLVVALGRSSSLTCTVALLDLNARLQMFILYMY